MTKQASLALHTAAGRWQAHCCPKPTSASSRCPSCNSRVLVSLLLLSASSAWASCTSSCCCAACDTLLRSLSCSASLLAALAWPSAVVL